MRKSFGLIPDILKKKKNRITVESEYDIDVAIAAPAIPHLGMNIRFNTIFTISDTSEP